MPTSRTSPKKEQINPDFIRMYYEHQYDRIEKNENQAMTLSNIVFTITALILTFGFNNQQSISSILTLFLPLVIIISNTTAILYIRENTRWIKAHQIRAKRILDAYAPELYLLDKETTAPHMKGIVNRSALQYLIHTSFIAIAGILFFLFILK